MPDETEKDERARASTLHRRVIDPMWKQYVIGALASGANPDYAIRKADEVARLIAEEWVSVNERAERP